MQVQCNKNITHKTVIKRKLFQKYDKPIDNIIISMPILVKVHYIKRYEYVCSKLGLIILSEIGVQLNYEQTYEHAIKITLYEINE